MGMNKTRFSVVVGLMLAIGSAAALWAADAADTTPPAQVTPEQKAEARTHFNTARELFSRQKYQEAAEENNAALSLDPNFHDAQLLKQLIERNLPGETGTSTGGTAQPSGRTLLTKEEVNHIKLGELSPDDMKNVRGTIPRKDLEDFWNDVVLKDPVLGAKTSADRAAFLNPANFAGQIDLIQREQATKYLEKVNIVSDPQVMLEYKKTVQPFVLQNCATARCHGGKDNNGGFQYSRAGADPNTVMYTNFYVLSSLSINGKKVVDRDNPESSLLIAYAISHPGKVTLHRITSVDDPTAKALIAWIKSLHFPAPNYGVALQLPTPPAATTPGDATPAPLK
jgi:hypothetical protein